jgi:hypothetical protein
MTRTELIIQLLKVAIGLAFGAYFVWWSLEVLDRLTPENEAPTPAVRARIPERAHCVSARTDGCEPRPPETTCTATESCVSTSPSSSVPADNAVGPTRHGRPPSLPR